jgi:hypothetical protein
MWRLQLPLLRKCRVSFFSMFPVCYISCIDGSLRCFKHQHIILLLILLPSC